MGSSLEPSEPPAPDSQFIPSTSALIPGSTIGKHLRHTHDHFRLLLDSLAGTSTAPSLSSSAASSSSLLPLSLSYDTRSRNITSETSHAAALESFVSLQRRLEVDTQRGRGVPAERRVLLDAVTPVVVQLESTWGREVRFLSLMGEAAGTRADWRAPVWI